MAGLDVYDRVFFQKNKRWIKQMYYYTPCISPETIFFKIFENHPPGTSFVKSRCFQVNLAILTVFWIFYQKFIPALGHGLGHGQAGLAMARPAI